MTQTQFDPTGNQGYVPPPEPAPTGGGIGLQAPITSPQGLAQASAPSPHSGYSSFSANVFGLEKTGASADAIQAMEKAAYNEIAADPDPTRALNLRKWVTAAPTLPAGSLLAMSQAGIGADSELGQWLIRSAVPALGQKPEWQQHTTADVNNVFSLVSDPDRLHFLQQLPIQQQANLFKHGPWNVGKLTDAQLQHLAQTGNLPDPGWTGYIGDVTRPVFAGLAAGAESVAGAAREGTAATLQNITDIAHGESPSAGGAAAGNVYSIRPKTYEVGKGKFTVGGSTEILPQTELGQAILGKNLGSGLFPGGTAHETAVVAQKAAASINGHALTPGRALATFITTPGSKPYQLMSGTIDFTVAMKADPAQIMLAQLGETVKAARMFSATTPEAIASTADHLIDRLGPENAQALKTWAMPDVAERYQGAVARSAATADLRGAIIDKISKDPGSLQQLVEQGITTHKDVLSAIAGKEVGLLDGLARRVDPQNGLSFLNSPAGVDQVKKMAGMTGTQIYLQSGKKIPPEIAWKLGEATTDDAVRAVYGEAIGTQLTQQPYLWSHPFQDLRLNSHMPNYMVDSQDPNAMVERAMQELQLGKVPKAEWDQYLRPLATAENRTDALNGYKAVGNRIADQILAKTPGYQKDFARLAEVKKAVEDTGIVPPELDQLVGKTNKAQKAAREMTTYFQRRSDEERSWWVDAMGQQPSVPGLAIDGEAMPIDGPYGVSELLNRGIPVIGGDGLNGLREIKRSVSTFAPLYASPAVGSGLRGGAYLMDHLTSAFKIGVLARLALPVRFIADEHARMATAGVDSMFHNPMSFIAYALGSKGETDITGANFLDQLADHQSVFRRAVGQAGQWREELFQGDKVFGKGWGTFTRSNPNFETAWADRLSFAHMDDVGGEVARSLVNVEHPGLDAVKDSFWGGKLARAREDLINANLSWGSANLNMRAQSDAYVDGWVQRLHDLTGGHPELMDAVATGAPWHAADSRGTREFRSLLSQLNNQEKGPQTVVGPILFEGQQVGMMRRATNTMMSLLMSAPTSKLTRSPAFRQFYFKRVGELLPYMDDATRSSVIERAAQNGIKLQGGINAADRTLSLEHADLLSKDFALQSVHRSLYYPGERSNAVDQLRNIIPFGNAWKNVLTSWAKLTAENPQVIRRVQQGVTDARESGWWFKDPQDGIEKFTIMPASLVQHAVGVPFPMVGEVKGLNIVGQGLPGVGPVVQWPAAEILGHFHGIAPLDYLHQKISPYGDPDFSGGVLESLFPGWIDKLKTSGWFDKVPIASTVLGQSGDQRRILDNVAKQAFEYEMSTGRYDMHDPNVLQKVWAKAQGEAQHLYLLRGMAQFVSPAAPQFLASARLKDGALVEQWVLAQDYKKMLTDTGDSYKATLQFVDKYGPDLIFATQPDTRPSGAFSLPTTAQADEWKTQNPGFANTYPALYGYWAPTGGSFDRQAYLDQIASGEREALSGPKWLRIAEARLGNAVYNQKRLLLPASPNAAQKTWLDQWRTKLTTEYPGFNQDGLKIARDTTDQTIAQLKQAVVDPAVRNDPLSHAITVYLGHRDDAIAQAGQRGFTTLSGQRVADLRDWLFQWGTKIATDMPEFTTIWNDLLSNEVDPNA